jgi:LacI family transcriptional regulator
MARSKATIRDVASSAGVHASTVSRVLNPSTRHMVTAEIARKVTDAAQELGYRPNPAAHSLRTKRSNIVGLLVPDITNPIMPQIMRGVEDALAAADYIAIVVNTDGNAERHNVSIERMLERHVEGLILATAQRKDPTVERCLVDEVPLVLLNRTTQGTGRVTAVLGDDPAGIKLAVNHLAGLGHQRIAHIAGPIHLSTGYERRRGFLQAMEDAGLKVDPSLIVQASRYSEREGQRAMSALLDQGRPFTAVVTANDLLAIGCYDVLIERELRCPQDISITGFNDMPFADKLNPPLTTIKIQHYEMGVRAGHALLERIQNPNAEALDIKLEPSLVIRGSTARAM